MVYAENALVFYVIGKFIIDNNVQVLYFFNNFMYAIITLKNYVAVSMFFYETLDLFD